MAFGGGIFADRIARAIGFASGVAVAVIGIGGDNEVDASEPGWSPVVIATGEYRESIKSMPIEARPYRPLHFYGNTRRRIHYRGTPVPIVVPSPDDRRAVTPRRSGLFPAAPEALLRGRRNRGT